MRTQHPTGLNISAIQKSWQTFDSVAHIRPIHNEKEYDRMIIFMNALISTIGEEEEHPLSGLLDLVGELVSKYEKEHYPIERAEPQDVLRSLMDARGLKQSELTHIIHQSNLSAILSGKRKISAALASKLGKFFDINPAVFLPN